MRYVLFILALLVCVRAVAQDVGIAGVWLRQTPQLWQQLELNRDGTYQRSIVTADSQRTEIGRWRSDVSMLLLQPDHVITAHGARVPLPPREKLIDVAGIDSNALTLYYDGDAVETWQRQARPLTPPSRIVAAATAPLVAAVATQDATIAEKPIRRPPRAVTLPVPQVVLSPVSPIFPSMPDFLIAPRQRALPSGFAAMVFAPPALPSPSMPIFAVAADDVNVEAALPIATVVPPAKADAIVAVSSPRAVPAGLYAEAKVVELITQIACEELRYPQRELARSEQRYRELAHALGFEAGNPARLQRTLRYYQSNTEFLRVHQQTIAQNSLRCAMAREEISALP